MTATPASFVDNRGARGSNAGDQFHELWALQQALNLLIPTSAATAITVEGIASNNPTGDEAAWDGVDCAVYYGGETIETADRVELSQLKYSSANPNNKWTISRLSHSDKLSGNNSVLRRLADAFIASKKLIKKGATISVRLVSNQNIAKEFTDCLKAKWTGPLAKSGLSEETLANLKKIKDASGLKDTDLRDFLSIFDTSECGTDSRFSLKNEIIQFTAQIVATDSSATTRELMSRVRDLMMPDHARDIIKRDTILGWFEVTDSSALFPAPSAFKPVQNPIIREPAKALNRQLNLPDPMICVHGEAGCGKTTTLSQLQTLLASQSILVRFDCYGAGRYLRSTDRRHLPEHAFIQILNEISIAVGLPFVIPRRISTPLSTKFFFERIAVASSLLKQAHPQALLVIAIDAADNSVTAAHQSEPPEPCFVTELTNADLGQIPANVRLVFSARSGRKNTLSLPDQCVLIPCPPFTRDETKTFVRQTLPDVSEDWIDDFQSLSKGIPRVQDYALTGGNKNSNSTLNLLRPGGKAVSDVLRSLFKEAIERFGKGPSYGSFMSMLAALPTPIPIHHFSGLTAVSEPDLEDFVRDTFLGLRSEDDGIIIADEDVEDFIRDEGRLGLQNAQIEACRYFENLITTDTYAAINIADLLVASGQEEAVLPIV